MSKLSDKAKKIIDDVVDKAKEVLKDEIPDSPKAENCPVEDFSHIISKIAHPNRKILATRILEGDDVSSLSKEFGAYSVQEMQRQIDAINGKPWVCKTCSKI